MRTPPVPADLATLAWAAPGEELEIRHILRGAGPFAHLFIPGTHVLCRAVEPDALVFRLSDALEVRLPPERARYIQVERVSGAADLR